MPHSDGPAPASIAQGTSAPERGHIVSAWLTHLHFQWDELAAGTRLRRFAKEETLFLEGQVAETVYLIQEGRVRLTSFGFDGRERHLMIVGANGLAGDCGLRSTRHYVVSAVAATDCVVRPIPVARLAAALAHNPRLAAQHQELASMRLRIMLRHVALQGSNSSRRRVCLHLLDLVHSYGTPHRDGTVIAIPFTQQEMGSICGLSRVSVSHIFTQLERELVIARAGRLVVVADLALLEVLSRT